MRNRRIAVLLCVSMLICLTSFFGAAVYASGDPAPVRYEAEAATLSGDAEEATDAAASGEKCVLLKSGSMAFSVNAAERDMYTLTICYKNNNGGPKTNNIDVNGVEVNSMRFDESETFTKVESKVFLAAGTNEIAIVAFWGWIDVDYIELSTYVPEPFTISENPVSTGATKSAIDLYSFLKDNFQKRTISGVMTGDLDFSAGILKQPDVQAVYDAGGHYPALAGFDLLFATGQTAGESFNQEYTNKTISLAKELWEKGGIPAFTWHWKDPGHATDAFYTEGAGTPCTSFDFTQGFKPGTTEWDTESEVYKQLVADIDHISDLFLGLQKDGVAAIFRPLHEAGGRWYWWSAHGGSDYAALYRLVYDRMVNINGVNNLIWVFNPNDDSFTEWDPGQEYYDVLSADVYNDADDHSGNDSIFNSFAEKFRRTKIMALSEVGPIPDVDNMYDRNAEWSWWMSWYESWSGGFVSKTSNEVWEANLSDGRIITLDDMSLWPLETPIWGEGYSLAFEGNPLMKEVKVVVTAKDNCILVFAAYNDKGQMTGVSLEYRSKMENTICKPLENFNKTGAVIIKAMLLESGGLKPLCQSIIQ